MEENISQEKKGVIFELGIAADTPPQPSPLACPLQASTPPYALRSPPAFLVTSVSSLGLLSPHSSKIARGSVKGSLSFQLLPTHLGPVFSLCLPLHTACPCRPTRTPTPAQLRRHFHTPASPGLPLRLCGSEIPLLLLSDTLLLTFKVQALSATHFSPALIFRAQFSCVCELSHVQLFTAPWTAARQAPLSMESSTQECWSRLPPPAPGGLPNPQGPSPSLLHLLHWQTDSILLRHLGSHHFLHAEIFFPTITDYKFLKLKEYFLMRTISLGLSTCQYMLSKHLFIFLRPAEQMAEEN